MRTTTKPKHPDTGGPDLPVLRPEDGRPRRGRCPRCRHEPSPPKDQSWLVRKLGLKPRPASCAMQSEDWEGSGGIGPIECGCRHPFHGS